MRSYTSPFRRFFIACFLLLFVVFGLSIHTAQAQLFEDSTVPKDVALLFYKMSGRTINYQEWAQNTQEYATAVDSKKETVLQEEIAKLEVEYATVEEDQTDVIIRSNITTKVEDSPRSGLHLDFSAEGPLFFPYQYMNENFAVIAQNIDLLKFIPLGKLEATYIKNKISDHGRTYMVLKVRPHRVDSKGKTEIFNQKFWLMLGRIASIHLYNKDLETLWSWTAEWYISEQDER